MSIWDKWKEKLSSASSLFNKWFGRSKNSTTTKNTDATTAATATDSKLLNSQAKTTQTIPSPNVTPENNNISPENKNVAPEQQVTEAPAADSSVPTQQNTSGSDDRFLNWYKEQFGKDYTEGSFNKTEGMSDKDYETGNNLYQAYIQKQNLEKQHNSAMQSVDESTARQRQEASILRDKMSKYLNLQNKNNGLNNLGISESVGLQADSQYMNNLGSIEANANTEKTNLLNNYFNNKTNIDSEAASNEQNILDKYQKYEREDEQKAYDRQQDEYNKKKYEEEQAYQREQDEYNKKKSAQDSTFNEFMSTVESGSFNTAAELEEFYKKFKDKLSPEQQMIAEQQIRYYKNNPDQQKLDKETEAAKTGVIKETDNEDGTKTIITRDEDGNETVITKDKDGNIIDTKNQDSEELAAKKEAEKTQRILEGKEYINYKGKNYQLKSQLGTNANELRRNDNFKKKLKDLGFTNPFDPNIPDGTTLDIKVDASGKDETNAWDWIAGILTVGMSTLGMQAIYDKTITYYKGNWYVSEKK